MTETANNPSPTTPRDWRSYSATEVCAENPAIAEYVASLEARLLKYKQRMDWLHDCSTGQNDLEGYEWGIYRVKWENGRAVSVMATLSDLSDLDAEMRRERLAVEAETQCSFPDCGCDGARLCCAKSGPNDAAVTLNQERGSFRLKQP